MSLLAIRDLENDQELDPSAMSHIRGGYSPLMPSGVSLADASGSALAIGPNAYTKTDTFAVAVPFAAASGSHSMAVSIGNPLGSLTPA